MLDTLQSPTVILAEQPVTAQDVFNEIFELVVKYEKGLSDKSVSVEDFRDIVKEIVATVQDAGFQADLIWTYPKHETYNMPAGDFVIVLKSGIGITGRYYPNETKDAFGSCTIGRLVGYDVIEPLHLYTEPRRLLKRYLEILDDEGVLEMAR